MLQHTNVYVKCMYSCPAAICFHNGGIVVHLPVDDDVFTRLQLGLLLVLVTTPTESAWMRCCTGKCYTGAVDHHKEQRGGAFLPMQERADLGALGVFSPRRGDASERKRDITCTPRRRTPSRTSTQNSQNKNLENRSLIDTGHGTQSSAHHERTARSSSWQAHREQVGEEAHQIDARRSHSTRSTD